MNWLDRLIDDLSPPAQPERDPNAFRVIVNESVGAALAQQRDPNPDPATLWNTFSLYSLRTDVQLSGEAYAFYIVPAATTFGALLDVELDGRLFRGVAPGQVIPQRFRECIVRNNAFGEWTTGQVTVARVQSRSAVHALSAPDARTLPWRGWMGITDGASPGGSDSANGFRVLQDRNAAYSSATPAFSATLTPAKWWGAPVRGASSILVTVTTAAANWVANPLMYEFWLADGLNPASGLAIPSGVNASYQWVWAWDSWANGGSSGQNGWSAPSTAPAFTTRIPVPSGVGRMMVAVGSSGNAAGTFGVYAEVNYGT